jgi:ribosome-binding factor A
MHTLESLQARAVEGEAGLEALLLDVSAGFAEWPRIRLDATQARQLGQGQAVSVSDVEVTRDMAHAKVFVTALIPEQSAEAIKGLKALAPELRYQLAQAIRMRHVPELHFHYDDSVDRGERIDALLKDTPPE